MRPRWFVVAIACAAILPHLGALANGFVFDDQAVIVNNPAVTGFNLHALWTEPYWPHFAGTNLFRPLTSTSYALAWAIGGGKAWVFVAMNLILHAAVTLAALSLLGRVLPRRPGMALASLLLFAVHPIHVEAVVGIVGRAELLAALFSLLSYCLWLDAERDRSGVRSLAAVGLWVLALLSKEGAMGLPLLLLAHRTGLLAPRSPSRRLRMVDLAWPVGLALVILLRVSALGSLAAPHPSSIDNPLAPLDPLRRALGAGGILGRQLLQLLLGTGFSADYGYLEVTAGPRLYAAGMLTLIGLGLGLAFALTRGRKSPEGWGIAFFFAFWVVTSNLVLPIGTVQADRLLYFPLLGLLVVAVSAANRIPLRLVGRYVLPIVLTVSAASCFAVRSALRTREWRDDRTLFEAAVRETPRSLKARSNLAAIILQEKTPEAAKRALAILEPVSTYAAHFGPFLSWQAKALMFLGQNERSRELYRQSLQFGADSAHVLVELGNLAIMAEDGVEALACFDAVARTGNLPEHAAIGRASALATLGRYDEAADAWLPVVASLPDSVPVRTACAWNLTQGGRAPEAAQLVREGLERSNDPRLWSSLARALLGGAGTAEEALQAAGRAVEADPSSEESLATLALAQIAAGQRAAAADTRTRIHDPERLQEIDRALRGTEGGR